MSLMMFFVLSLSLCNKLSKLLHITTKSYHRQIIISYHNYHNIIMNLSFSILFMLLSSTATGAIHGSRPRSIQIVDDDCDDYGRCARTLYPPSGPTPTAEMDLP